MSVFLKNSWSGTKSKKENILKKYIVNVRVIQSCVYFIQDEKRCWLRTIKEGNETFQSGQSAHVNIHIQPFQLRLSPSKAEKSNTSAKSLLGVTIQNTQTEQNLVSRDT